MLSLEKLANATIKNRAEVSKLYTELNRIDKEKQNELRMLNNEKQRFRARYSKLSFYNDPNIQEASDVKMYETHNPGFCFKRNGEHKVQQIPLINLAPTVDFEHLQFLLFTNGEVDIEKVLSLHLLSTHETKYLTPTHKKKSRNSFLAKETPLEQLLERSEEATNIITSAMILPAYIIDMQGEESSSLQLDPRLSERLLVNEKILELVQTVVNALENSNPHKAQHLVKIATDVGSLKRIFRKNHIQEFLVDLKHHPLISSCSSFILTQPNKFKANHIEIRTASGVLEELIKHIHENVLQPSSNHNNYSKEIIYDIPINININASDKNNKTTPNSVNPCKQNEPLKLFNDSIKPETRGELKNVEFEANEKLKFRRSTKNFIMRNIIESTNYRRCSEDETPPKRSASLKQKSNENRRRYAKKSAPEIDEDVVKLKLNLTSNRKSSPPPTGPNEVKFHLKQTTCPACMEKWRTPLPSPKISNLAKAPPEISDEGSSTLKTDNKQRLSMLIEREQFHLDAYDRRYSNPGGSSMSGVSSYRRTTSTIQRGSFDLVTLDVYDLEKIRQEIREMEVKKKLQKFLQNI